MYCKEHRESSSSKDLHLLHLLAVFVAECRQRSIRCIHLESPARLPQSGGVHGRADELGETLPTFSSVALGGSARLVLCATRVELLRCYHGRKGHDIIRFIRVQFLQHLHAQQTHRNYSSGSNSLCKRDDKSDGSILTSSSSSVQLISGSSILVASAANRRGFRSLSTTLTAVSVCSLAFAAFTAGSDRVRGDPRAESCSFVLLDSRPSR